MKRTMKDKVKQLLTRLQMMKIMKRKLLSRRRARIRIRTKKIRRRK